MKKRLLTFISLLCAIIFVKAEVVIVQDHLYYTLNEETKEAMLGVNSNSSTDEHTAMAFPELSDSWWQTMTPNFWENISVPSTITHNGETYTVTSVSNKAFYRSTEVHAIELPETITSIGSQAFYWAVNLESINIPSAVTAINDEAFVLCRKIKSIHLPENISQIGPRAFSDCVGLEEINIPGNCTFVGQDAFKWCKSLKTLSFENGNAALGLSNSYGIGIDYQGTESAEFRGLFADCPIKYLYLGRNLSYPASYPPFECISNYGEANSGNRVRTGIRFDTVEFGEAVTDIPAELFYLSSITNPITLPANLRTIGEQAFWGTSGGGGVLNQTEINFPATLESVGGSAFSNCNDLRFIRCEGSNPPILPDSIMSPAFWGCNIMVHVPAGAGEIYRNARRWSQFPIIDPADELLTINVKTAGTLYSRILAQDKQLESVTKIKLKGTLNDDDWTTVRSMQNLYFMDLSELTIEEFPSGQFDRSTSLIEIKLPTTLSNIADNTFSGCPHLSGEIIIPTNCSSIGVRAFVKTNISNIVFTNSTITIGENCFRQCPNLDSVEIVGQNTIVGDQAFWGAKLKHLKIGKGVSIGTESFFYCQMLEDVIFADSVKSIGECSFGQDKKLTKLVFQGYIENIGENFIDQYCNINEIHVSDISKWCQLRFPTLKSSPLYYCHNFYINDVPITDISLPDNTLILPNYAFYGIETLESVTFPKGLKEIGDECFYGCGIETLKLPSNIEKIGANAFNGCFNIKELYLPLSLSYIGEKAFANCSTLNKVVADWKDPFSITNNTFSAVATDCFLYIPIGTATKYLNAGWNFPNLKEAGILTISVNEGGSAYCYDTTISNQTEDIFYTPYRSFYVDLTPNDGYELKILKLDGRDVLSEVEDGKFLIEEPEENMTLSAIFADPTIAKGDINGDGIINSLDIVSIINYILKNKPEVFLEYYGDVNDDDIINITDVYMAIKRQSE